MKTYSEDTKFEFLVSGFVEGVRQVEERAALNGINVGILVFDKEAYDVIKQDPRVRSAYIRLQSIMVNNTEAGFLRLVSGLRPETSRAYYALVDLIKIFAHEKNNFFISIINTGIL